MSLFETQAEYECFSYSFVLFGDRLYALRYLTAHQCQAHQCWLVRWETSLLQNTRSVTLLVRSLLIDTTPNLTISHAPAAEIFAVFIDMPLPHGEPLHWSWNAIWWTRVD